MVEVPWFRVEIIVEAEADTLEEIINRIHLALPPRGYYHYRVDTPKYNMGGFREPEPPPPVCRCVPWWMLWPNIW